jgi:hypothetical protein
VYILVCEYVTLGGGSGTFYSTSGICTFHICDQNVQLLYNGLGRLIEDQGLH